MSLMAQKSLVVTAPTVPWNESQAVIVDKLKIYLSWFVEVI